MQNKYIIYMAHIFDHFFENFSVSLVNHMMLDRLSQESTMVRVSALADLLVQFPWRDLVEGCGPLKEEIGKWLLD